MLESVNKFSRHFKQPVAAGILDHARRMERGSETDRTVFFSDAVFAIAMTLLALDLKLPDVPDGTTLDGFNQMLLERGPSLAAFALSFALVGRTWLAHHRRFKGINAYDGKLQVCNLWMLFFVAFLPVPTSILFQDHSGSPWPPIMYALTNTGLVLAGNLTWHHAYTAGLMHGWVDQPLYRLVLHGADPVWVVFLLSIPVAFVDPSWAMYTWILIWPLSVAQGRRAMARFVRAEAGRPAAVPGRPAHGS